MSRLLPILLFATSTAALAQDLPRNVHLRFEAEAGLVCPDEAEIRSAVGRCLAPKAIFVPRRLNVHAQVRRDGSALAAEIRFLGADGTVRGRRQLPYAGRSCQKLTKNLVVVLCFALDRYATPPPPSYPPPALRAGARLSGRYGRRLPELPRVVPAPSPYPLVAIVGGLHLAAGLAPGPAFGAGVGVELLWARWSVLVSAEASTSAAAETPHGSVRAHHVLGTLALCMRAGPFATCALGQAGVQIAGGDAFRQTETTAGTAPYLAVGARLAFEHPVGKPLALRARFDLLAPAAPARIRFSLAPAENGDDFFGGPRKDITLWEAEPITFAVGLDLLGRF